MKELKGHTHTQLIPITLLTLETRESKSAKTHCALGGWGALPVAELKVFFSNRLLRILHCLDTVPPLDQVLGISLPCAVVM